MATETPESELNPEGESEELPFKDAEGEVEFLEDDQGLIGAAGLEEPKTADQAEWEIAGVQMLLHDLEREMEDYLEKLEKGEIINPDTEQPYTRSEIPEERTIYLVDYDIRVALFQDRIADIEGKFLELSE